MSRVLAITQVPYVWLGGTPTHLTLLVCQPGFSCCICASVLCPCYSNELMWLPAVQFWLETTRNDITNVNVNVYRSPPRNRK